jgi:hypothetical protein
MAKRRVLGKSKVRASNTTKRTRAPVLPQPLPVADEVPQVATVVAPKTGFEVVTVTLASIGSKADASVGAVGQWLEARSLRTFGIVAPVALVAIGIGLVTFASRDENGSVTVATEAQATPMPVQVAAATVVAAADTSDITGSISARPPVISGWSVLEVAPRNRAIVQGRNGIVAVRKGTELPGAGRVEEVRQDDGLWVVVTSAGIIVSR